MLDTIMIVGGGLGGLGAALALRRAGFEVDVYERAARFGEVGAGVTMTPPALRAMDALGLGAEVVALSDSSARASFFDYRSGDLIKVTAPSDPDPASALDSVRVCHRTDLHRLLLTSAVQAGVRLHNDHALTAIEPSGDGVTVAFANGRSAQASLLIGADGLRSTVREKLFDQSEPRRTGLVAFRALLPSALVQDLLGDHPTGVHLGPGATLVYYLVRHGETLNCVGIARSDITAAESWSTPATRAEFKAQYRGWHQGLYDLVDRIPEDGLFKWPLFDREPLAQWTHGRVALLGDAAHPMLPFLGIGAAMALEDAVVLANTLGSASSVQAALAAYVDQRQARATEVTYASRRQGEKILGEDVTETFSKPMQREPIFDHDVRK